MGGGRGYWPTVAESARITSFDEENGLIEFEHAPISKFKIVFPLANPVIFTDDNRTTVEAEWKARYIHIAEQIGAEYDSSCKDISRAFYSARVKNAKTYRCIIGGTVPLELPPATPEMLAHANESAAAPVKSKKAKGGKKGKGAQDVTYEYWKHSEEFDVVGWLPLRQLGRGRRRL